MNGWVPRITWMNDACCRWLLWCLLVLNSYKAFQASQITCSVSCLSVFMYSCMRVSVVTCDSLFSLLVLSMHVNMYPCSSGQCVSMFALVCKATNSTSFILFKTQEECQIQRQSRGSVGRGCTVGLVFCLPSVYYMGLHLSRYCQQG